ESMEPTWISARGTSVWWVDPQMARVGVLELVDQGDRVLLAQAPGQGLAVGAVERGGDAVDQVVVGLHPQLALERGQPASRVRAPAVPQGHPARPAPGLDRPRGFGQG